MNIKIPRGTYDLFGSEMRMRKAVVADVMSLIEGYGFEEIKTPIFEETSLFKRSSGDDSDIVNKEMYTFLDRKERSLTLRPELTAPIVRSYIENKMYGDNSVKKLTYYGEAFRYERPQKGRYRQFHQIGVEVFNSDDVYTDVEVISLAHNILNNLQLNDNIVLKINTIGDVEHRAQYVEQLKQHFASHQAEMCSDCQKRLATNPLRILDCKIDGNKQFVLDAPAIIDYLSTASQDRFKLVCELLAALEIPFEVDETLVRGLDYYNDTVFEFVYKNDNEELTVIAGGRYDKLVGNLSNQEIPAFGFGIGVERLVILLQEQQLLTLDQFDRNAEIFYIPLVPEAKLMCLQSMNKLRNYGLKCEWDDKGRKLPKQFELAEKLNCVYAIIIGADEIASEKVSIRNLITKESFQVYLKDFEDDIIEESGHDH